MSITKVNEHYECDGMCFDQSTVLNEIFKLQGVYFATGINLGKVDDCQSYYIKELSRTILAISIYCRSQLTSYFHVVDQSLSEKQKLIAIKKAYPGADNAIFGTVGALMCPEKGCIPITFYQAISKLCHVEKWKYPLQFAMPSMEDDEGTIITDLKNINFLDVSKKDNKHIAETNILEVEVNKTGSLLGCGEIETLRILPYEFSDAARIFITDCETCQIITSEPGASCETSV